MDNRYFQWVVGERRGEILIFDRIEQDDGEIYITFKNNSRINEKLVAQINQKDLTGKMMAEIDSPQNCWKFVEKEVPDQGPRIEQDANSGNKYEVPSIEEIVSADLTSEGGTTRPTKIVKKKQIELIPPKPTPPSHSVFGAISKSSEPALESKLSATIETPSPAQEKASEPIGSKVDKTDPVYILMSKAKKSDLDISMEMSISLPPKTLYDIAKESFDNGDDKFLDYIVDEIATEEIKEALKIAIRSMYEGDSSKEENTKTNVKTLSEEEKKGDSPAAGHVPVRAQNND